MNLHLKGLAARDPFSLEIRSIYFPHHDFCQYLIYIAYLICTTASHNSEFLTKNFSQEYIIGPGNLICQL